MSPYIPYRNGSSDVFALFVGIFCAALCMLFIGRILHFEPLRRDGQEVVGRWIDGYLEPRTGEFQVIYRFEVGEASYRGRQSLLAENYSGDGHSATIIYLPDDPKLSRVAGTEGVATGDAMGMLLAVIGLLLALQHIAAYYRNQASWALRLRGLLK